MVLCLPTLYLLTFYFILTYVLLTMTSTVLYQGDLRTQAVHLASSTGIITDAPTDNNGKGEAFSPTDLVATALASCLLTIMGIVAARKGLALEGTKVAVQKIMAANPRRISRIELRIEFAKNNFSEEDRQILENAARTCPVAMSLHPDLEQVMEFVW